MELRVRRSFVDLLSLSVGNYTAVVLSVATSVILVRVLGAEQFGRLTLLLTASQVLSLLVAHWTQTGLIRFGAREYASRATLHETFWARTTLLLPGVFAAAVIVWVAHGWIAEYLGMAEWGVLLVLVHFVAMLVFTTAGGVLQATERMSAYGAALSADKAIALLAVVSVGSMLRLDAALALGCSVASMLAVSGFLYVWFARQAILVPIRSTPEARRELLRFSLPLIVSGWAGLFGGQWIDYVVIKRFRPLHEVGLYALAYQVVGTVQQLTSIAATVMLPRYSALVASSRHGEVEHVLRRTIPSWLLAFSLLLGVTQLVAGPIVSLIFGAAFVESVAPLRLLLVATSALAIINTFNPVLAAYGFVWSLTAVVVLSVGANVVFDLALVPVLGITGAAAATVVSYFISAGAAMIISRIRLGINTLPYLVFVVPVLVAYASTALIGGAGGYVAALAGMGVSTFVAVRMFAIPTATTARAFVSVMRRR